MQTTQTYLTPEWIENRCFYLFYSCIKDINPNVDENSGALVSVSIIGLYTPDPLEIRGDQVLENKVNASFHEYLQERDFEEWNCAKISINRLRDLVGGAMINLSFERPAIVACPLCGGFVSSTK
jgi:hypothetical protein